LVLVVLWPRTAGDLLVLLVMVPRMPGPLPLVVANAPACALLAFVT